MIDTNGLYLFLTNDPAVSGLIGNRVYKGMLPLGYVLPSVVFMQVASEPFESLAGDNPTKIRRFQFDCFAKDSDTAHAVSDAVYSLLVPQSDGSGTTQDVSFFLPDGTFVQSSRLHVERDVPTGEGAGGGPGGTMFGALLDIEITYTNP